MRKGNRGIVMAVCLLVLGGLVWAWCPERRAHRNNSTARNPIPPGAQTACQGWPDRIPRDDRKLAPFLGEGYQKLLQRDSLRAWDAFALDPPSQERHAGLLRARLETGKILAAARDLAFVALRIYLDRRIDAGLSIGPGEAIVPLLRAALALQSGETRDIARWTRRIPPESPLAPAAAWLVAVAPSAPVGTDPRDAAVWWKDQFPAWVDILGGSTCPVDVAVATDRLRRLANWLRESSMPPPRVWRRQLRLDRPGFRAGTCGADATDRLEFFDPSIYTVLSVAVLEEIAGLPDDDMGMRFLALQAGEALGRTVPEARLCAPTVASDRSSGSGDPGASWDRLFPYLVYGDQLSPAEMRAWMERVCAGEHEHAACPRTGDEARRRLEAERAWEKGCVAWLETRDPDLGRLAERFHFYGGPARARLLEPLAQERCPASVALQGYQFWKGSLGAPSPWWSLEARLRWVALEARSRTFRDGPTELFLMAEGDSIFFPLAEMVRGAELALRPVEGEMAATVR